MAPIYSTVQKLTLAGMVIGGIMCAVGACAPYWLVSDVQGSFLLSQVNHIMKMNLGLFLYCMELFGESRCEALEMSPDSADGWYFTARACGSFCVLGSGLAGFIALCLACCHCCHRFICLGFLSFLSACSGAMSLITFYKNMDIFTYNIMDYKVASYGWAFYVFCAAVALEGLISFTACFSSPEQNNAIGGTVVSNPAPPHVLMMNVGQTHPYVPLQEQGPNQYPVVSPGPPGTINQGEYHY